MIKKYLNFINESVVYYSPPFRKILMKINDEISKEILNAELKNIIPDMTFIDLDKDGYLSYIRMVDAKKLINNTDPDKIIKSYADLIWSDDMYDDQESTGVYKKSRNRIKLIRFINKLFPKRWTDVQLNDFANRFKDKTEDKYNFEIVSGKDIEYWYNKDNYVDDSGTLGRSCMGNKRGIFEIYINNPDVCRMLILKNNEGNKILGRALVWKVTNELDFKYFMDRVYTNDNTNISVFHDYTEDNKWAHKSKNNHNSYRSVLYNGIDDDIEMEVSLKKIDYKFFPFMDTFRTYDPYTYKLINDELLEKGKYILDGVDGEHHNTNNIVYSDYYGEDIDEEASVYSQPLQSYIYSDNAVYVSIGNNIGYYPDDSNDLTFLDYAGRGDYACIDDCVYSEYEEGNIFKEDAIDVITSVDISFDTTDTDPIVEVEDGITFKENKGFLMLKGLRDRKWYKKLNKDNTSFDGIERGLMTIDYKNDHILKKFSKKAYKSNIKDLYLTKIDSKILDIIIEKEYYIMDAFEYYENIKDYIKDIKLNSKIRIDEVDKIDIKKNLREIEFYSEN